MVLKVVTCFAAALLYVAIVSHAFAWEANPEPGYCAQFFPNADCNSIGPAPKNSRAVAAPVVPPKAKKSKRQSTAAPQHEKRRPAKPDPVVSR